MSQELNIPPQDLDSEKAVLASIMLRPEALYEVEDLIHSDIFYADKHKIIYQTMLDLHKTGDPIDVVTLTTKLEKIQKLDQVGGRSYLAELVSFIPSTTNARYYATSIYEKYTLRRLINASQSIIKDAYAPIDQPVDDILDHAEKQIFQVTSNTKGQKFIALKDTLDEAWERIERLHDSKGELRGIPTGYKSLDNMLAGFQNSDLIILAARPSMGKTTLALDIARLVAINHNVPVGIFSLEMSSAQLVDRMLAAESRVNAWNLRTGQLSIESDFSRVRDGLERLSRAPIFIDDQSSNSITKMKSFARKLKIEHGLGLIIIDYLQLMSTSKNYDSMVNQVTEISRSLKGLARDLNVPVIALSQLSRNVESRGGKPRLSDLRDSGSIEQDADVVMFIHREDRFNENSDRQNIAEILIEKHRNGPVGKVELYFDEKMGTFLEIDQHTKPTTGTPMTSTNDPFNGIF
jgi:replicative DNA helicase